MINTSKEVLHNTISISFFVALILMIASCGKHSEGVPHEIAVLDSFGEMRSPSGVWSIVLSDDDPALVVTRKISHPGMGAGSTSTASSSPVGWTNREGFFCLVDLDDRIWAFDGGDKVWILEHSGKGTTSWGFNYPGAVPVEVVTRLPDSVALKFGS